MRLREKGKKDGEVVTMGWDEAQTALRAGTHEVAEGGTREGGESGQEGGSQSSDDRLDAKTQPELEALATERGIDVSGAKTKADVIAAMRARP